MKLKKIKTDTVTNNFINIETGEIIDTDTDTKHQKIVIKEKEAFCLMYGAVTGIVNELDKISIRILVWCATNCIMNSNKINLGKPMCDEITKLTGLSYGTIKNSITRLSKAGALISLGSGTYRVHPRYFWRGADADRMKTMRYVLEIEYNNEK